MSDYTYEAVEAAEQYDEGRVAGFADGYADFIDNNRTEREIIEAIRGHLESSGAQRLSETDSLEHGQLYYHDRKEKNLAVFRYGGLSDVRAVASHVDSPCLHLKPFPVQEEDNVALLKSRYYGGIKPYQWLNLPLSLHGTVYTDHGRADITLGDDGDDPVFTIPDLLPHLSDEQRKKTVSDAFTGEELNALAANTPTKADEDKLRDRVLSVLNDEYGVTEEDLVGAELRLVPAHRVRDVGVDRALLTAYGHDDRSSVYASLEAIIDADHADRTQLCVFYDKEEIGSEGTTGAKNAYWSALYAELRDKADEDISAYEVWENTSVLSADVTAASNPNFNDVQDPTNVPKLGHGVSIKKYTGGRGKSRGHDASAELTSSVIQILRDNDVPWQSGELGKMHIGGGGTIAKFIAKHNAEVLDIGVPVLGMHAPHEVLSKADLYSSYEAYKAFLSDSLEHL